MWITDMAVAERQTSVNVYEKYTVNTLSSASQQQIHIYNLLSQCADMVTITTIDLEYPDRCTGSGNERAWPYRAAQPRNVYGTALSDFFCVLNSPFDFDETSYSGDFRHAESIFEVLCICDKNISSGSYGTNFVSFPLRIHPWRKLPDMAVYRNRTVYRYGRKKNHCLDLHILTSKSNNSRKKIVR